MKNWLWEYWPLLGAVTITVALLWLAITLSRRCDTADHSGVWVGGVHVEGCR